MFDIERDLILEGKRYIVGIDEVGRGPLAGDVIVCAVCFDLRCLIDEDLKEDLIDGIKDSKKLSDKKRRELAGKIKEKAIGFSIAGAPPRVIDKVNILQATIMSMEKALEDLTKKLKEKNIVPDMVLVDSVKIKSSLPCTSLNKGDDLCYTVGAASILAKVYRDNLCKEWEEKYPGYEFSKHKGYGTKTHREALINLGPCEIHRASFLKNLQKWKDQSKIIGDQGENKALEYLEKNGYKIIGRNYKVYSGEIDLIARKDHYLVFVEVKSRKDDSYGYGYEAVDKNKQKKIKMAAEIYYHSNGLENLQPRFDVIEIYTDKEIINHYEDAFW